MQPGKLYSGCKLTQNRGIRLRGILKCDDVDWSLGMDIGALYRMSQLGFMKDFRIGASVNGLGKNYSGTEYGVKYEEEPDWYKYAMHDYSVATGNSWIFRKYIYDRYFELELLMP